MKKTNVCIYRERVRSTKKSTTEGGTGRGEGGGVIKPRKRQGRNLRKNNRKQTRGQKKQNIKKRKNDYVHQLQYVSTRIGQKVVYCTVGGFA